MDRWIFKILRPAEWAEAEATADYAGAPVDVADGYIHFSTRDQLAGTAGKYFADEPLVHIVAFDAGRYDPEILRWEPSRGGALFPHLYGPLDVSLRAMHWPVTKAAHAPFDFAFIDQWITDHA